MARTLDLGNALQITFDERGDAGAQPAAGVLLLHGGAGPDSMLGLADALAEHAYVVTPTHPGFGGTPRTPWLETVGDLADAYLDLLEGPALRHVMVIGNSFGGWIAAEMALRDIGHRLDSIVLLNATGIRPDRADQITDIRQVPPAAIGKLAFHNPALRPDPAALTDAQRAGAAANQKAMASYAGDEFLFSPKLRRRLHRVETPALVAWGLEDGVLMPDYGRAYANAFGNGRFLPIPDAGHFPHIEQPKAVLTAIGDFVDNVVKPDAD